jgi:hypothetical protein
MLPRGISAAERKEASFTRAFFCVCALFSYCPPHFNGLGGGRWDGMGGMPLHHSSRVKPYVVTSTVSLMAAYLLSCIGTSVFALLRTWQARRQNMLLLHFMRWQNSLYWRAVFLSHTRRLYLRACVRCCADSAFMPVQRGW